MFKPDQSPFKSGRPYRQAGYLLASVLILLSLLLIVLAVGAPKIATEIQRDREAELSHRGLQYARAIRLYYKQFGKYPSSISQLEKTNGTRFLRKRYRDPITRGDEWRIIHLGEARLRADDPYHVPPEFGKGIAGETAAQPLPPLAPNSISQNVNPAAFQSSSPGSFRPAPTAQTFGFSQTQATGFSSSQTGGFSSTQAAPGLPNAATTAPNDLSTTGSQVGTDGQPLGGLGIVGVASLSPKKSMREYKHQQHYNQWEFTYDASLEVLGAAGLGLPQPVQPTQSFQNGSLLPSALQSAPPPGTNAPSTSPQ